jgi:hypothetical protein
MAPFTQSIDTNSKDDQSLRAKNAKSLKIKSMQSSDVKRMLQTLRTPLTISCDFKNLKKRTELPENSSFRMS